jgi:hypothetical protein
VPPSAPHPEPGRRTPALAPVAPAAQQQLRPRPASPGSRSSESCWRPAPLRSRRLGRRPRARLHRPTERQRSRRRRLDGRGTCRAWRACFWRSPRLATVFRLGTLVPRRRVRHRRGHELRLPEPWENLIFAPSRCCSRSSAQPSGEAATANDGGGSDVQWVKDILATGSCSIETRGRVGELVEPELITDPELRPAPPHVRFVERRIAGVTQ